MTRSRLALSIVVTIVIAGTLLGQDLTQAPPVTESENPNTTRMVDEFGRANDCDLGARVDGLFIQLINDPQATGYVIAYAGADYLPSQYESLPVLTRIRMNISFRRYDPSRLVFIKGGFREHESTEFFLVPHGGEVPKPTNTVPAPKAPRGTFLWSRSGLLNAYDSDLSDEEFLLPEVIARQEEEARQEELAEKREAEESENDVDAAGKSTATGDVELPMSGKDPLESALSRAELPDPEKARDGYVAGTAGPPGQTFQLDGAKAVDADEPDEEEQSNPEEIENARFSWADDKFGLEISRRKGSRGVIIFYADDQYYDIGKLTQFVEQGSDRIAAEAQLQPNQIRVVFGGYRQFTAAEYYIVPKGGKTPKSKPEQRPVEETQEDDEPATEG